MVQKKSVFSITLYNTEGLESGSFELSKKIFGSKVSDALIAQYVRVYLANQRQGTQSVKTRGEVIGSTRKIYRQKGTGRARHGSRKAPLFVGGGSAHAPKPRDYSLKLNKKQKIKALYGALSQKVEEKQITIVEGLLNISAKTKDMMNILKNLSLSQKKRLLLICPKKNNTALRQASSNIANIDYITTGSLNAYTILSYPHLIFAKEAVMELQANTP